MYERFKIFLDKNSKGSSFSHDIFFGVASGLPSSLVFGTLSIWLREEGLTRTSIGLIGLAATPYAINFLWAPLVDRLPLGPLTALFGQRRSWIMACQLALALCSRGHGLSGTPNDATCAWISCAFGCFFLGDAGCRYRCVPSGNIKSRRI